MSRQSNKFYNQINGREREGGQAGGPFCVEEDQQGVRCQADRYRRGHQRCHQETRTQGRSQEDLLRHPRQREGLYQRLPRTRGQGQPHLCRARQAAHHHRHGRGLRTQEKRQSDLRIRSLIHLTSFSDLQYMIITIVVLAIDWAVLYLNGQTLLRYHAMYIAFLVLKIWRYQQPEEYVVREASREQDESIPGNEKQNQNSLRTCLVCNALKPDRYYHCKKCKKCIYLMDHHCSWVGNCIGQYNSKVYLHLLVNIFLHSALVLLVTLYNSASLFDVQNYSVYYWIDFIPGLYSTYQTYRLISDFWLSVKKNQTLVESYKKVHGQKVEVLANWEKYMGKGRLAWLIPTFSSHSSCNLLEKVVYPRDEQVKEYDDPEDYIFGPSEQDEQEEQEELMKTE